MTISARSDADMGDLQSLCVAELLQVDRLGLIYRHQGTKKLTVVFVKTTGIGEL